ncbi:CHC2 zinc finger domain-containing protein [Oceanobacillus oncorhynchi]|uniref:CHC2 zinc finger domain-containing protein n=1 Tax=Oceanobacillus oncorhynchi TaxID=545501 RepID=UPI001868AA07|nr:CHC2 zinc finger domain-containing protein [Oceanobacillus oncorhynchi]
MLPNILDVAQTYAIEINPKSYGKKETLAKCPFCNEDSRPEKRNKFYLSLNTNKQVYRCFYCGDKGGVLQFEAKLSNTSFDDIRQKYFGQKRKSLHPAYRLNPEQLSQIGWQEYKRRDINGFREQKNEVEKDWKQYVYDELVKYFALYICVKHLDDIQALEWFKQKCKGIPIQKLYERILNQYRKKEEERNVWAIEGTKIARIAWTVSIKIDQDFNNLFVNVLIADYLYKKEKTHSLRENVSLNS